MSAFTKEAVLEELRAVDVAAHYDMRGAWRGRWLRTKVCPTQTHSTDAMGLARDGMWHCWSCDEGGDLFKLIALAEGIDIRRDFPKVLEIAAGIAGVQLPDDDFGGGSPTPKPPKPKREAPPLVPSLLDRVASARKRAAWLWDHLTPGTKVIAGYLTERGLDPAAVLAREDIRSTPLRVSREQIEKSIDLKRVANMMAPLGIAIPVRHVEDGELVDVRVRRLDPGPDRPKVIGMLGGVVSEDHTLVGCYGNPHAIETSCVIVVEGVFDYLTALQLWPSCDVLGATHAGSYALVARHAAKALANRGGGKVVLVAQNDDPETDDAAYRSRDSVVEAKKDGAADRAVDHAAKNVINLLGLYGPSWVECRPFKDLNDMVRAGATITVIDGKAPDLDFGE